MNTLFCCDLRCMSTSSCCFLTPASSASMLFSISSSCELPINHAFLPNFSSRPSSVSREVTYSELVYARLSAVFHCSSNSGVSSSLVGVRVGRRFELLVSVRVDGRQLRRWVCQQSRVLLLYGIRKLWLPCLQRDDSGVCLSSVHACSPDVGLDQLPSRGKSSLIWRRIHVWVTLAGARCDIRCRIGYWTGLGMKEEIGILHVQGRES